MDIVFSHRTQAALEGLADTLDIPELVRSIVDAYLDSIGAFLSKDDTGRMMAEILENVARVSFDVDSVNACTYKGERRFFTEETFTQSLMKAHEELVP